MATTRQIHQTLEESYSLKLIAQAYSEIAAMKLQRIRSGIEKNRDFFEEISKVFRAVKVAAANRNMNIQQVKKGVVSILLTSNHRFYGNIEEELIRFYVVNTTKFKTDRIVVGKIALEFLQTMNYAHKYASFTFKNDLPNVEELKKLALSLSEYQQILVYYPRMQSVLIQEPHVVDLLQQPPKHYLNSKEHTFDYIFEPEIDQIISFFDNQITTVLLEQTFLESELARTAARLISMDKAQMNADDFIKAQKKLLAQAKRSTENIRLLETVGALSTWQGVKDEH
jgi:F-type H+-transporting ATPase subunit gamma